MSLDRRAVVAGAATLLLGLTACGGSADSPESTADAGLGTLAVAATAVPAAEILAFVNEQQAPEAGLELEIVEFSDYITPNTALDEGSVDANLYQHVPYLEAFNAEQGTDLVSVGEVYLPPLALYSRTVDAVEDLPDGASITLPNDPTNEGRALNMLADAGLIEVTEDPSTVADITANPRGFEFTELDAAALPRALDEVDAGIVNLSFALPAGLTADEQILAEEVEGSPFNNILAVRAGDEDDPRVVALYDLLTSDETAEWIREQYNGLVIPVP